MGERLHGKVSVITGAARGIGKAMALLFAREGARLILADLDAENCGRVAAEINSSGGEAVAISVDVSLEGDVRALAAAAVEFAGRIDVLVNNAGINHFGRITDIPADVWDRVMAVNVRSVFLTCKYMIPVMQENGGGSIVNVASVGALVGLKNLAVYTASKGAVMQLSKNLALDYASWGIRVNALCPGVTATEMTMKLIDESPSPVETRQRYDSGRPLGRIGDPEEIATAALFLASDESSYMTGSYLLVDGGYCAE